MGRSCSLSCCQPCEVLDRVRQRLEPAACVPSRAVRSLHAHDMSSKPKAKGRSKRVAPDQVEEAWTTEGREKPRDRLSTKEKYSTLGSDRSALYEKDDEVEPMAPAARASPSRACARAHPRCCLSLARV